MEPHAQTQQQSYRHQVTAWWSSGRTGLAQSLYAPSSIHFAAPPQFGGLEGRWTPEDLLLGAIASCFTTTFRVLAEYSKWDYLDLQVEVDGRVSKKDSGYQFVEVTVRPHLEIQSEDGRNQGLRLLEKANDLCLISRALSVPHSLEPLIEVVEKLSAG
jgi:organic hydroperoxide reductase OsmC/OhrA